MGLAPTPAQLPATAREEPEVRMTLSWRGMDSNFQYAEAVKLVIATFSCAGCLGRVGVLRFSSFSMSGKRIDGAWLLRHRPPDPARFDRGEIRESSSPC
jgi:hypothetical protein